MMTQKTSPFGLARLAVVATLSALVGAGVLTGVLFGVGAIEASDHQPTATPASTASTNENLSSSLNAAAIYASANPSVVEITATQPQSTDIGTGFVIDSGGHILTADHVVSGASSVAVKFQDGSTLAARVVGQDQSTDVAVVQVNPTPSKLPALPLGNSNSLVVGDSLAVIGNPFGFNHSLSTGVVSAIDRTIQAPNGSLIPHALQTDAPINPGNSGGPVLDAQGSVVGIVDQIATGGSDIDSDTGVGFAVPIDLVEGELSQLEQGIAVVHSYLGVSVGQTATSQPGALVQAVAAGSPAAAAGIRGGDLIVAVDGTAIRGPSALIGAIAAKKPGGTITLQVLRGSTPLTITARLAAQPAQLPTG